MNGTAYKLLGYAVWRGGKWYLRQRLPSSRSIALVGAASVSGAAALAVIARRLAG